MIALDKFIECVKRSWLVAEEELRTVLTEWKSADPEVFEVADALAEKMVDAKLLTRWQASALLLGKSTGFFLGPYKLLGPLGTGGSASVFLGEHMPMRTLRAIKVLPVSRVHDSAWLAKFGNEAVAIAKMKHPNIVIGFDFAQHGKYYYIVSEYVDGTDLQASVTARGPLEPVQAAKIFRQAADALDHAHKKGTVHRDVKPSHLMIGTDASVYLIGWGMSRSSGGPTHPLSGSTEQNLWSTFDYVAPEQLLDHELVDPRTDIYSLGCTLYFALTGEPPFPDHSPAQRIVMHQNAARPRVESHRPDTPPWLAELCGQMMAHSPDERPQTAAEVVRRLGEA